MTARAEHAPKPGKRRAPKRRKAAAKRPKLRSLLRLIYERENELFRRRW